MPWACAFRKSLPSGPGWWGHPISTGPQPARPLGETQSRGAHGGCRGPAHLVLVHPVLAHPILAHPILAHLVLAHSVLAHSWHTPSWHTPGTPCTGTPRPGTPRSLWLPRQALGAPAGSSQPFSSVPPACEANSPEGGGDSASQSHSPGPGRVGMSPCPSGRKTSPQGGSPLLRKGPPSPPPLWCWGAGPWRRP